MNSDRQQTIEMQWNLLRSSAAAERQVIPHAPGSERVWIGMDKSGDLLCFALLGDAGQVRPKVEIIDGLWLGHESLSMDGTSGLWLVLYVANDKQGVFAPFVATLLDEFETCNAAEAFQLTLRQFRSFWMGLRAPLDSKQLQGLFGELEVLMRLLENCAPAAHEGILWSWTAPKGALHDYTSNAVHLEVKAVMREPVLIHVNDIGQVAPLESASLTVVVTALSTQSAGRTIAVLVEQLRGMIASNLKGLFDNLLRDRGYSDQDALFYPIAFRCDAIWFYPINAGAPILDPALVASVPATVSHISYRLAMSGFSRHTPTPEDWAETAGALSECLLLQ